MTSRKSKIAPMSHAFLRLLITLYLPLLFYCIPSDTAAEKNVAASHSSTIGKTSNDINYLLSQEEKNWLQAHPEIVLGAATDYPPMVISRDDGTYVGVLVDLFDQINQRLNARVRLHIVDSWAKAQEMAENREIDGLAFGARDPSRDAIYNATDVVMTTYFSVFGRSKSEYPINRFSDLDGMSIGYKKGARPTRTLLEKLPSAILKAYESHESLTQALLAREIDVIVAWMSYDHWRKDKMQGTIDNILLITEHPIQQVTYVRKDWPELIPILNKAIASLQTDELPRITNKWFGFWPQQSMANPISLTLEEQAWLDQNKKVRVRIIDYPPYQIVTGNQEPQGISIEYLNLLEDRIGIEFEYAVTDQPFSVFLDNMKREQGPDMTALITPTPGREQFLSFTKPYLSSPFVIFIREGDKPILDIQGLAGKTIAVPRSFTILAQLESDYPEIKLSLFDSDQKALAALATGQADAYIGNLTVASHIIHQEGLSHLKATAATPYEKQLLSMGNRKDWQELTSILDKALESITEEEKTSIRNKYLAINFEQGINKAEVLKWMLIIGASTLSIFVIFLFWNRQMSREISRRKETELSLQEAIKNAETAQAAAETANKAKSTFLANMSHELRTPLNAILGFSKMLVLEPAATANQREKLAIINRSGQHLLAMINDVLDISKIEVGKDELQEVAFDLSALIKEVSEMIQPRAKQKGLSVVVELESITFRYLKVDVGKIRQILINLLNNAVKFTDRGKITIRCGSDPIPEEPNRCMVVIEVEDTGPGIQSDQQAIIFEPFVQGTLTSERKGTGLGLSICKQFSEYIGGTIELESEPDKGSLFRVRFPAHIADAMVEQTVDENIPRVIGLDPPEQTWRILVVDDNPENLLLLKATLEEVGFSVLEARNGKEAVEMFSTESPHFIWMDMRMPVMDGYEAVRLIRQLPEGGEIPISAITASAFSEQRPEILAAGCDDMVTKPFRAHEIFETMGRFLDVAYIYEPEGRPTPIRESEVELTSVVLTDLPADLLQELRNSSLSLDTKAIAAVIERIETLAPDTAKGLKTLLDNYQIGRIRNLVGETDEQ